MTDNMHMIGDSFGSLPLLGFPRKATGTGGTAGGDALLKEDGDNLLLETGDNILLE